MIFVILCFVSTIFVEGCPGTLEIDINSQTDDIFTFRGCAEIQNLDSGVQSIGKIPENKNGYPVISKFSRHSDDGHKVISNSNTKGKRPRIGHPNRARNSRRGFEQRKSKSVGAKTDSNFIESLFIKLCGQ